MTTEQPTQEQQTPQRMLTFASGGWVLLAAGLLSAALMVWALAGPFARSGPLIGDGHDVETYGFDLSNLSVGRATFVAGGLRKDALKAMVDPPIIAGGDVLALNKEIKYGKYLVTSDRVIGLYINGEARAYPIRTLNRHEVVNDTLGGTAIAVTYNPLCDSAIVFERTLDAEILEFGVSGLLYNSNLIMFDRRAEAKGESLWSQLLGRGIAGPLEGRRLKPVDAALIHWGAWLQAHPQTTVLDLDWQMFKGYQELNSRYDEYLRSPGLIRSVEPMPEEESPGLKAQVVIVEINDERKVYPLSLIAASIDADNRWTVTIGGESVEFIYQTNPQTVYISPQTYERLSDTPMITRHALWFAWHAMYPEDEVEQ